MKPERERRRDDAVLVLLTSVRLRAVKVFQLSALFRAPLYPQLECDAKRPALNVLCRAMDHDHMIFGWIAAAA